MAFVIFRVRVYWDYLNNVFISRFSMFSKCYNIWMCCIPFWLGTVAHFYNTGYSKAQKTPISTKYPGMGAYACESTYTGGLGRKIMARGQPWAKM
jgi:hypothetical protein